MSGSSSSSYFSVPSSFARPRIWTPEPEAEAAASASASSPEGFAASPIFWNLPAATRTEAPRGRDRDAIEAPRARVETRADDAVGAAGAASDDARDIVWDVVEHGAASRFGGAAWRRLTDECRARVT